VAGGFTGVHVPFRGGPEALTEVMTGRVDFTSMGMSAALPLIRDGKLVALAVSTPTRSKTLPDVPTTIEAGLPDSDYVYWMGLFAPAKTPPAIIERLRAETEKALKNPNVVEKFAAQGIEPMPLSPAAFDALIRKEIQTNIALVKAAGLKFN
jgi:tripartite-type tricarboxylate transporter receptor subunit TctC